MSAIDKLKDGLVIDATDSEADFSEKPSSVNETVGINIDTTDESNNRINLSNLGNTKGRHQIVLPKNNTPETDYVSGNVVSSSTRQPINIDSVAAPEEKDESIHESYEKDILDVNNPESIFRKYVDEKEEEAKEWIAEKEEERRIMESEKEDEDDKYDVEEVANSGSIISAEFSDHTDVSNLHYNASDDLDISKLMNDEDEDDKMSEMNDTASRMVANIIEQAKSANVPEEDINDHEESVTEVKPDNSEVVKEPKKVEEKEEAYYASDINVEEVTNSNEKFTTEIIEEDEDETLAQNEDTDEFLKHLQKLATEKLKPVSNRLNISSFTVLKKPTSNITPLFNQSNARVAKWVLPAQESIVLMKEFSGSELEKLREYSESSNSVDALNRRYHMIYDHIVSPKPASFETWLKTTPFEDVDHYFFAIYIASFKGSNYLPEDCINPSCKETFLTDDVNIMDMVKFDTKEAKAKFAELYQSEAVPAGKGIYCTEIVPISEKIAIGFRQPSIYNVFEIASIDEKTRVKYSSVLDYIPYIDTIYAIDYENQALVPISYKMFADNAQRTIKSKIMKYDNIFSTLSVDEFGPIKAYVGAIAAKTSGMKYVYPAVECPKCHTMTTEQGATAEELVFTRYQLGSLVTISLN